MKPVSENKLYELLHCCIAKLLKNNVTVQQFNNYFFSILNNPDFNAILPGARKLNAL